MPSSTALEADPSFLDALCCSVSAAAGARTFECALPSIFEPLIERGLITGARLDFLSLPRDFIAVGASGPGVLRSGFRVPLPLSTTLKARLSIFADCPVPEAFQNAIAGLVACHLDRIHLIQQSQELNKQADRRI